MDESRGKKRQQLRKLSFREQSQSIKEKEKKCEAMEGTHTTEGIEG